MPTPNDFSQEPFSLDQASDWTRRYREQHTDGVKGHCFSRATLEAILAQPGCTGVRAYYGRDAENQRRLVLVGTDAQDNDMLPTASLPQATSLLTESSALATTAATDDTIIGPGKACPPACSMQNILNS
ncbi:hypothetical protein HNQ93_001905 [Hymenobacter luteus]|uniref:Uncharacterized protein n=2 Tax=Hymenobacter TaxID=89966 RepID=A0A7W9T237_9BACT|nr:MULTISPECIES: hypothetical protein [Hymenobacter]MBB4600734.1 hypothetical protein [Hymenobacter latericoloratus]MBB6059059.1 hypothetical protein [Hymenobacter luteus]